MATEVECDSDLEGKDEAVIIHGDQASDSKSNTNHSKKRSFAEMEEDDDNHYSSKHSKNKFQKLDHGANKDIDGFLDEDDDEDEDEVEDEDENEDEDEDEDAFLDETDDEDDDDDDDLLYTPKKMENKDGTLALDQDSAIIQNVEFELKDIHEYYYHEVKDILSATDWDQNKLHVTKLADTIVKQEEVGGVLTCQDSVMGFITLLSFKKYFEHLSLAHIKRFLLNRIKKLKRKEIKYRFEQYFSHRINLGLLLHERPVNIPIEVLPHIYDSLCKDIEYATNKEKAKHLNDDEIKLFKYDYIMMVVRYRYMKIEKIDPRKKNKQENKEKKKKNVLLPHLEQRKEQELVYEHVEDALFVKKAQFQFDFERLDKVWNVLFIEMEEFKNVVKEMQKTF